MTDTDQKNPDEQPVESASRNERAAEMRFFAPLSSSLFRGSSNGKAIRCPFCGQSEGLRVNDVKEHLAGGGAHPEDSSVGGRFDFSQGGVEVFFSCSCGSIFKLSISGHGENVFAGWFAPGRQEFDSEKRRRAVKTEPTENQLRYLATLAHRAGFRGELPESLTKTEADRAISMLKAGEIPPFMKNPRIASLVVSPEEVAKQKASAIEQNDARIADLRTMGAPVNEQSGLFIKSDLPKSVDDDWQTESQWGLRRMRPKQGAKPVLMHVMSTWRKGFRAYYNVEDVEPIPYRNRAAEPPQDPKAKQPGTKPPSPAGEQATKKSKKRKGKRKKGKKKPKR